MKWNLCSSARIAIPALMFLMLFSISDASAQYGWNVYPGVLPQAPTASSLIEPSYSFGVQTSPIQTSPIQIGSIQGGTWNQPHQQATSGSASLALPWNAGQRIYNNSSTPAVVGFGQTGHSQNLPSNLQNRNPPAGRAVVCQANT